MAISIPGLSGYDFSGIVSQMVELYRMPETQMKTKESDLKTQKDAWREVNTRLSALNTALTNLRKETTWTASKAISSNEGLLTATTTPNAIKGTYNIKIMSVAQAQTVTSTLQVVGDADAATTVNAGSFNIKVGTEVKTINVSAGDSLNKIASSINSSEAGVKASVIQVEGGYRLAVISDKTGTANAATFANVTGTVLHNLGILDAGDALNISQQATDAKLTVNGIQDITSSTNIVTSAIPGVTMNLNGSDGGTSTINLTISPDNTVAENAVQEVVDKYNSAMEFISSKMSYDKDSKKAGVLFGDAILQSLQSRLRGLVTSELNNPTGPYNSLSLVGIKTVSANDAKLNFDKTKFTEALQNNPNSVANLFGAPAGGVTPSTDPVTAEGLANILESYLEPKVKYGGSISQKQDSLDKQIRDVQTRIEDFEDRVARYEEMLKNRFTGLETLLTQMNSQSSWLSAQLGSTNESEK